MKEDKRYLVLDKYEHGIVINALNDLRTKQIKAERPSDPVDELLEKTIVAPNKRFRVVEKSCSKCHEER
ncbi:MAG: hypothetical protein EOM05_11635 [Clostridia bacterium]|nr:hypothetical protein [Clostridia bacterium]